MDPQRTPVDPIQAASSPSSQQTFPSAFNEPHDESERRSFPLKKILLVVGVLLLLGLVGTGSYILGAQQSKSKTVTTVAPTAIPTPYPTADPTENWKTYTNRTYGWAIKHPSSWIVSESEKAIILTPPIDSNTLKEIKKSYSLFIWPSLSITVKNTPIENPSKKYSFFEIPPTSLITDRENYYYAGGCVPSCGVIFDAALSSSQTLHFEVIPEKKETLASINKTFNLQLTDIDHDTYKTVFSTLSFLH